MRPINLSRVAFLIFILFLTSCFSPDDYYIHTGVKPVLKPQRNVILAGDPEVFKGYNYIPVEKMADTVPVESSGSIKKLTDYLCLKSRNDLEKTRAIFRWITKHIQYDGKSFAVRDIENLNPQEIFLQGKGVCGDYSVLFQEMADIAGLQSMVITGKASGYPKDILLGETSHAWNALKLNGSWYLLDVTWSSGFLDENYLFHYFFSDRFFLTKPSEFIKSHLPDDPHWQLLDHPVTEAEFIAMASAEITNR